MANQIKMSVDSREIARLTKKLLLLEPKLQKKYIKGATTKAMRPVTTEAKRQARKSKRSGFLAKSITQVTRSYSKGVTMTIAGAASKKDPRTGENPANISHLIEFPVKPHRIVASKGKTLTNVKDVALGFQNVIMEFGKEIEHPGFAGRPFLTPAFDSKSKEAERIYARELEKAVVAEGLKP